MPQKPKGYLIVLCAGIALYLFSLRHGYLPFPPYWSSLWVERKDLGVIRLLDIGALTYLLWSIVHYTRHVEWSSGMCRVRDFFARMGRHSLPVFTAHVVLIYLTIPIQHTGGLWARYGTGIGLIIILYALAWLLDARADQQKRMKQASPA